MEFKNIRLFAVLAEEMHFGRAAHRAGVTQSVMSAQIKRLEDELGVALFNRTTREVSLTSAGAVFRTEAVGILRRAEQAKRAAVAIASGGGRLVRIGVTSAVIVSDVMRRISDFHKTRPEIQIAIRELGTIEQEAALGDGEIDIGILHPPLDRSNLISQTIETEPFFALMDRTMFDLPQEPAWRDVFALPIVFYVRRRAPRLYDGFVGFAQRQGLSANIVAEAETFLAAIAMAKAGLGIALLPSSFTDLQRGLDVVPLRSDCPLSLTTACAIHARNQDDAALLNFCDILANEK